MRLQIVRSWWFGRLAENFWEEKLRQVFARRTHTPSAFGLGCGGSEAGGAVGRGLQPDLFQKRRSHAHLRPLDVTFEPF